MNHFENLNPEKRERILNAGFQIFGRYGYGKASTADIAKAAGISKAMIFHYFDTKKAMYFYLLQEATDKILGAMQEHTEEISSDFFDRILDLSHIKVEVLKAYPGLFQFLYTVYQETDPEVTDELKQYMDRGAAMRNEMVVRKSDVVKFREGVSPELVMELVTDCSLGVFSFRAMEGYTPELVDQMMGRIKAYLSLLKKHLYKEEYL
ncbi:MAG: TetR/AcrR family transcriptional regulator [Lachnospiraceae bacterium]|nr:TetR/AcrR family transcriptional regulator [Lachnospiraceae bacterium]